MNSTTSPPLVPENDEILVRVCACGICRADLHVVEGEAPRLYATMPASSRCPLSTEKSFAMRGLAVLIGITPAQIFPENLRKSPQLAT